MFHAHVHQTTVKLIKDIKQKVPWVPEALAWARRGFRQVLKSDPREKPLDQSAIPLIVPNQLQAHLYQNIQNLDVLLIDSLEILNVSNALIGLQSQQACDHDTGGLKVTKIKSKQSNNTPHTFTIGNIRCLYVRRI